MLFCVSIVYEDQSSAVVGVVRSDSAAGVAKKINLGKAICVAENGNPNCGMFEVSAGMHPDIEHIWVEDIQEIESPEHFLQINAEMNGE